MFRVFLLILNFLAEDFKAKKNRAKKISYFKMQFPSQNLAHFTNLNSLNIVKNIIPQHFKLFQANMFVVGLRRNIWTAPFLENLQLHPWNTGKATVCIFLYIFVRSFYLVWWAE